jgi:hypothetical protein
MFVAAQHLSIYPFDPTLDGKESTGQTVGQATEDISSEKMQLKSMQAEDLEPLWLTTDWCPPHPVALMEPPVMYIGADSLALVQHTVRGSSKVGTVLDLCCGSGIQGLAAARLYASHATLVDLRYKLK